MREDKDKSAKECFSALQLIESNPVIWASLGCIFERELVHSNIEKNQNITDDKSTDQNENEHENGNANDNNGKEIENLKNSIKNYSSIAASDSFIASIEIAKPTEALFGVALMWLSTHSNQMKASMKRHRTVEYEQTLIGNSIS